MKLWFYWYGYFKIIHSNNCDGLQCLCSDNVVWDHISPSPHCRHWSPSQTNTRTPCVSNGRSSGRCSAFVLILKKRRWIIDSEKLSPVAPRHQLQTLKLTTQLLGVHYLVWTQDVSRLVQWGTTRVKASLVPLAAHLHSHSPCETRTPLFPAQCHVYPSRSWLGRTGPQVCCWILLPLTHTHTLTEALIFLFRCKHTVSHSWVVHAVNKTIQEQSVWVPCSVSLFILISSGITAVAHSDFWYI